MHANRTPPQCSPINHDRADRPDCAELRADLEALPQTISAALRQGNGLSEWPMATLPRVNAWAPPAARLSADEVYALITRVLREYLDEHAKRTQPEDHKDAGALDADEIDSKCIGKLAALGILLTPGVGKTLAAVLLAIEASQRGLPVLILARTNELARDYVERIRAAGGDSELYVTRQSEDAVHADPALKPWLCRRLTHVRAAGDQNHRPMMSICRECPFGRKGEYVCNDPKREQRALQWFRARDLDPVDYASCDFLYRGLPKVRGGRIIVAPLAAFSESLAFLVVKDKSGKSQRVQRLLIVDEEFEPGKLLIAGLDQISKWLKRIATIKARAEVELTKFYSAAVAEEVRSHWRSVMQLCDLADGVYRGLSVSIAKHEAPDLVALKSLLTQTRRLEQMHAGVAKWESVVLTEKDQYDIPMRGLKSIVESIESGVARMLPTSIEFYERSPVLDWMEQRGSTIILDASLPLLMRENIIAHGGQVVDVVARQNLLLTRVTGTSYARGIVKRRGFAAHAKACWRDYCLAAEQASSGGAWAQMIHMAHVLHAGAVDFGIDLEAELALGRSKSDVAAMIAAAFEQRYRVRLGWFGRHDRGQDQWKDFNMRIFSQALLGSKRGADGADADAEASEDGGSLTKTWRLARAAAISVGLPAVNWPEDVGDMDNVKGRPQLPLDPCVRRWLIDRYVGALIQAIGRARAARALHLIRVELWGGLDCPEVDQALARAGLDVQERWPNEVHRFQRGRPADSGDAELEEAATRIEAPDRKVTVRSLCAAVRAAGGGVDTARAAAFLKARKAKAKRSENTIGVSFSIFRTKEPPERGVPSLSAPTGNSTSIDNIVFQPVQP